MNKKKSTYNKYKYENGINRWPKEIKIGILYKVDSGLSMKWVYITTFIKTRIYKNKYTAPSNIEHFEISA